MHIIRVTVDPSEPVERALKRFRRIVEREGIVREWKRREFYEKPSMIRNKEQKALKRRLRKQSDRFRTTKNY